MPSWTGKWKGGRTYQTHNGRTVYVLRKMVQGKHYELTLEARSESDAEAELALFLRGPGAYQTRSQAERTRQDATVYLDSETVGRFLEYLRGQGRTEKYRRNVRTYLATWAEALAGRDLREVTLQELKRELVKASTARKHRIIALKPDLNPERIRLGTRGEVKLTDFGLATSRLAGRVASSLPNVKGEVFFASPGQLLRRPVDHRSDLFALGLVLLELLTGKHLFWLTEVDLRELGTDMAALSSEAMELLREAVQEQVELHESESMTMQWEAQLALRAAPSAPRTWSRQRTRSPSPREPSSTDSCARSPPSGSRREPRWRLRCEGVWPSWASPTARRRLRRRCPRQCSSMRTRPSGRSSRSSTRRAGRCRGRSPPSVTSSWKP
jgi:serine/threonine protein kinase